jgi:curved DNA-binding protein CbpA
MENIFIKYMREGRIRSLDELKSAYHRLVMKTHPDAVGSDDLVEKYIAYSNYYEEAKAVFSRAGIDLLPAGGEPAPDYRLLFYKEFYKLERIDKPYAFNKYYFTRVEIELTKRRASEYFAKWKIESIELYEQAQKLYDEIKAEKPRGPYMKYAMLFNLSPVFHNITSYQMTGLQFYKKQLKQNLSAIFAKLEERRMQRLIEFIRFLIADMENGPAILGMN